MTGVERIGVGAHLSHVAVHEGIVHLSGVVSPGQSVLEQTRNVLTGIDELLRNAGSDRSRILSATVWLTDMSHFDEMNGGWEQWLCAGHAPARVCVEAELSLPDFSVAIAVSAAQLKQQEGKMSDIQRIESGSRVSHAVIHNGLVYVGGVLSSGDTVREQTRNVLQGIDATLGRAGTDKTKLLSATVWLADMGTFDEMNSVWDAWVSPGNAPARACIEAKLIKPGFRVEIAVIAAV